MKRLLILITIGLVTALIAPSCNECRKIDCQHGGTCNDGACDCLKGYEGENCEILNVCVLNEIECNFGICVEGICECSEGYELSDCSRQARTKFLGVYNVTETCDDTSLVIDHPGNLTIKGDPLSTPNMFITGLFQTYGSSVGDEPRIYGDVNATATNNTNSFRIPDQETDRPTRRIKGSGSIAEGALINDSTRVDTLEIDYTIYYPDDDIEYNCGIRGTIQNKVEK